MTRAHDRYQEAYDNAAATACGWPDARIGHALRIAAGVAREPGLSADQVEAACGLMDALGDILRARQEAPHGTAVVWIIGKGGAA